MTRRAKRVAELVREELGEILLREICDPRVGFVAVTRVEMSRDLRVAKVDVSLVGTEARRRTGMRGLESALPHIRMLLGRRLSLRRTPELVLRLDEGAQRSARIGEVLSRLAREREACGLVGDEGFEVEEETERDAGE